MTAIAEHLVRPSAATLARREHWQRMKRSPSSNPHWFYKHTDTDKTPHTIEGHKAALEAGATSRHCMESYNKLTNHVFDGIAHIVYGWPHMGDAAALIALEETECT